MSKIKGYIPKKIPEKDPTLKESVGGVIEMVREFEQVKNDTIEIINEKIQEAEQVLGDVKQIVSKKETEISNFLEEAKATLNSTVSEALEYVKEIKEGEPGKDADEKVIVQNILDGMPKFDEVSFKKSVLESIPPATDENALLKKFLSKIPKSKTDLKVIHENITIDPMSVIEKILELPEDKFKLKTSQIEGLDQTLSTLKNQLGRGGYLHGGGFSNIYNAGILVSNGLTGLNFTGAGVASVVKNAVTGIITVTLSGGGSSSPLTTKGDIYGFSTVNARIPVGADGMVLTADSAQPLGVKWSAVTGTGTVTSVVSSDGSITVTNATTTPDLAVVKAPKWSTARLLAGNSIDGSDDVAFTNKFIVQGTTDTGLSGAQFLGALSTGIVKNTTTTGILSIAIAADFPTLNQNTTGSAATLTTARNIAITGDLAWNVNFNGGGNVTAAGTLTTVNGNVGTFGSATQSVQFTVNAKGLITAAANVTVTPAVGSITGLGTGVATFLATPSSANLAAAVTDETGTGLLVFATNPTLSGATFADATNIVLNATTGTKIGTATTQKLGFYNATPIVQPTGSVITALQNLGLVASATIPASTITSGAALTKADDTNVTLTLGGTPSTALLVTTSLTLGWTGTLAPSRGGFGLDVSTIAKGGMVTGSGAGTFVITTVGIDGTVWTADAASPGGGKWSAVAGTGTVTNIATAGLISGGPITTTGIITTSMNTNKLVGRGTAGTGVMEEITLGTGLSFSGTTLNATGGGGMTWTEVTGTSQTASVNNGYILNNAGLVTLTLPSTAAVGDMVAVVGKGAGGWRVAQNSGQLIHIGVLTSTTGVTGHIDSNQQYDSIQLICIVANTTWALNGGPQGTISVT